MSMHATGAEITFAEDDPSPIAFLVVNVDGLYDGVSDAELNELADLISGWSLTQSRTNSGGIVHKIVKRGTEEVAITP